MPHFSIKETCSCGAKMEYEDMADYTFTSGISFRQADFHKAHEKCRKIGISGKEVELTTPTGDKK